VEEFAILSERQELELDIIFHDDAMLTQAIKFCVDCAYFGTLVYFSSVNLVSYE
jgi:hypothetical protein